MILTKHDRNCADTYPRMSGWCAGSVIRKYTDDVVLDSWDDAGPIDVEPNPKLIGALRANWDKFPFHKLPEEFRAKMERLVSDSRSCGLSARIRSRAL